MVYRLVLHEKRGKGDDFELSYSYRVFSVPVIDERPDLVFRDIIKVPVATVAQKIEQESEARDERGFTAMDKIILESNRPFWVIVERREWRAPKKKMETEYLVYEALEEQT